jgi:hypothetical protein
MRFEQGLAADLETAPGDRLPLTLSRERLLAAGARRKIVDRSSAAPAPPSALIRANAMRIS